MRTLTKLGVAMTHRDRPARRSVRRIRGAPDVEEIETRAARLGITVDRVLQEYARIAFADLRDIVDWQPGEDGLRIKPAADLSPDQAAAIAEIVASASTGRVYRIKLHDKTPVLAAIGRCLRMFPKEKPAPHDQGQPEEEDGEDPREFLARELARLRAARADRPAAAEPARGEGQGAAIPVGVPGAA